MATNSVGTAEIVNGAVTSAKIAGGHGSGVDADTVDGAHAADLKGEQGPQGVQGKIGPQGAQGKIGSQGPAGSFSPPDVSYAIFGTGTKTHYTGDGWVLESKSGSNLSLRITSSGFWDLSMVYPSNCSGSASTLQTGDMMTRHRYAMSVGSTLDATFCNEGSPIYVTIWQPGTNNIGYFRCFRATGNANACQRILP